MGFPLLGCSVLFEEVRYVYIEARGKCELAFPLIIAINIRECYNLTALKDLQLISQLGFPSCGKPYELWNEGSADDGGLLRFDKNYFPIRVLP